jgi:hypothetical protein
VGVFDLHQGKLVSEHRPGLAPDGAHVLDSSCEFVDTTRAFVTAELAGFAYFLDVAKGSLTRIEVPAGASVIAPDGKRLALWDAPREGSPSDITIWSLTGTPKPLIRLKNSAGTRRATFSPDGKKLIVANGSGSVALFELDSGARSVWRGDTTYPVPGSHPEPSANALSATFTEDTREDLPRYEYRDSVASFAFSPDGTRVAITYTSGGLELRDVQSGDLVSSFRGHTPWPIDELREATMLARRLGLKLHADVSLLEPNVNPLNHMAALDQPLPEVVLEGLSRLDLRLLRAAVYARRGAPLKSRWLAERFASAAWYRPNPAYTDALLTRVDVEIIHAILRREGALGGPLTDAESAQWVQYLMYEGMYDFKILPRPPEPARSGKW